MYKVDRTNGSALISVIVSFFYYKSPCVYLWKNYDNIFRHEVIKGKQIHEYATKYLVRVGRIQPNEL